MAARHFAPGDRAHDAGYCGSAARRNRLAALDGRGAQRQQRGDVREIFQAVPRENAAVAPDLLAHVRLVENIAEVEAACLPVIDGCGSSRSTLPTISSTLRNPSLRHQLARPAR
jgi:hypothetical protein